MATTPCVTALSAPTATQSSALAQATASMTSPDSVDVSVHERPASVERRDTADGEPIPELTATQARGVGHDTAARPRTDSGTVPAAQDVPASLETHTELPATSTQVVRWHDSPLAWPVECTVVFAVHVEPPSAETNSPASPAAAQVRTEPQDTALMAGTDLAMSAGSLAGVQLRPPSELRNGPPGLAATQRLADGHDTP